MRENERRKWEEKKIQGDEFLITIYHIEITSIFPKSSLIDFWDFLDFLDFLILFWGVSKDLSPLFIRFPLISFESKKKKVFFPPSNFPFNFPTSWVFCFLFDSNNYYLKKNRKREKRKREGWFLWVFSFCQMSKLLNLELTHSLTKRLQISLSQLSLVLDW